MKRKLLLLAVLSPFAFAACKPQTPPEPMATASEAAPADEPAPADDADPPSEAPFDTKGFAGVFSGTLPCADCPGIDTEITLNRDGTYTLHQVYRDRGGSFDSDGTWTAEENGTRVRLDPNSKSEDDRLFAVVSHDQVDQLDLEGKPLETQAPHSLKRTGTAGK